MYFKIAVKCMLIIFKNLMNHAENVLIFKTWKPNLILVKLAMFKSETVYTLIKKCNPQ